MKKIITKIKSLFKKDSNGIYWSNTESIISKCGTSKQLELLKQSNSL